tara:strand:+ start:141 stop:578 length:438 start_codon:yes stop_codon:yes gene_type:complete
MFANNKTLSYPLIIIGVVMIICGFRWLIHPNPWMLDEVANVERLGITFDELFAPEINTTLPNYLRQIYRFFGFWVLIIGLFISILSQHIIKTNIGLPFLSIVGFMMSFGMYLGYTFIPSSHFIQLMWVLILCYMLSLYSFFKLKK